MTASGVRLDTSDEAILHGEDGSGAAPAMRMLSGFAAIVGAGSLLPIQGSHIDGCLFTARRTSTSSKRSGRLGRGCGCRPRSMSARST